MIVPDIYHDISHDISHHVYPPQDLQLSSQVDRDDDKADLGDSNYDEFSGYSGYGSPSEVRWSGNGSVWITINGSMVQWFNNGSI